MRTEIKQALDAIIFQDRLFWGVQYALYLLGYVDKSFSGL
jgi:hypothetical protein